MQVNKLLKYDYISFDIFDTLIKRNTNDCKDVFHIVEIKYNSANENKIIGFYEKRIMAEKEVRKASKEEITIQDIYKYLEKYYKKDICKKLKEIEINVELNVCTANKPIVKIYNELLENNKNIIITSDMYLDENTIKKILENNGICKFKKLYLSSTIKKRKNNGTLFDYIISDLKIEKNKIIHIGDNQISDFLIPEIKRIDAIHIKNKTNNLFYNKKIRRGDLKSYHTLEKFISNNINIDDNYYYKMGYETFGPILYGFINYINNNTNEKDNMFFLSRDGYLIQKAYKLINNKENTHYFYASRRALIVPTLWKCDSLKDMINKFSFGKYIKIRNLFKKLGLEEYDLVDKLQKYNYNINDEIKYADLFKSNFLNLFNEIKPIIYENSQKEFDMLIRYLKQEGFQGHVSIFDIGWNGNMQKALVDVLSFGKQNANIDGYYIGVVPESKNINKINMKGFLFDSESNLDIYLAEKVINPIFESMFLAPHGSVKKYKIEGEKIVPVFYDYEYDGFIEKQAYEGIQNGALQFISDFIKSDIKQIINLNAHICSYNLMKLAYYPTKLDINKFGDFRFWDEEIIYIAKPKKISYYLKHIKEFSKDLFNCGWQIGFLKRLTKINILYKQIYLLSIQHYLRKKRR